MLAWSGDTCKGGGKKDAELYVSILEDNLLSSIEYSEIPRGAIFFNNIITPGAHLGEPRIDSALKGSGSLISQHNLQVFILLNIS